METGLQSAAQLADKPLYHPVAEAIVMLKSWKESKTAAERLGDKGIHERLYRHAVDCNVCQGWMVSLSTFQKLCAQSYLITEWPYQRAVLHSLEVCFGIKPQVRGFQVAGEIVPDPLISEEQSREFFDLFAAFIAANTDLIGWGKFLPCSLETPEFIQEHHRALFREYSKPAQARCVDLYNKIGLRQRAKLEQAGFQRHWKFWHLMLRDDLLAIARGKNEFGSIPPASRKRCLEDLLAKISNPKWNIELVVADALPQESAPYLAGMDSVVCIGHSYTFRRDLTRTILYSTSAKRVQEFRQALESFVAAATLRSSAAVALLRDEIERIR